jgi:hypothetical protein
LEENTFLKNKISFLEDKLSTRKKRVMISENEVLKSNDEKEIENTNGKYPGLIYYIFDEVYTERAKIGRTQDMNVERLLRRYSAVFDPVVWFFYSDDIRRDEKNLKEALKTAGQMWDGRGQEKIKNTTESKRIFSSLATKTFGASEASELFTP